ncbi:MAG: DUF2851 domain-containing protein [Candidatus Cloacimonetes bacterium HGW-Cloacimonetes-1]|jgi:hypothetical protein|nr:MAG: DUF2851 domain-containing protein [Candidatus Cloacimonetes bacterium HGW-Cloacimonetes-1]
MDFKEKFLYHIWDEGHLQADLHTVCGKPVSVIYAGQLNTNRGPDFMNAVLNIEGEIRSGSIEIHHKSQDWFSHNHHEDPHYNRVILHVVYEHQQQNKNTIKEDGTTVEILELKDQLVEDIAKLLLLHSEESIHINYCDLLSMTPKDSLIPILRHFGTSRFNSKVKRYNSVLLNSDFDQVLYEGLMEAIGYDKNKYNMLSIAQTLKWDMWKQWYSQGMTIDEMISIALHSSGLIKKSGKLIGPEYLNLLAITYERQAFYGNPLLVDWQLFRIRPQNHPIYRIIALFHVLYESLSTGLLQFFKSHIINSDGKFDLKTFRTLFSEYSSSSDLPNIGKSVVSNITVNIILPILYLYSEKNGELESKKELFYLYSIHPGLMDNRVLNFMKTHASPSVSTLIDSKVILQQGLIDLYYRFCQYHLCEACVSNYKKSLSE